MELKFGNLNTKKIIQKSSNCTFMELKYYYRNDQWEKLGSNCTFMELK